MMQIWKRKNVIKQCLSIWMIDVGKMFDYLQMNYEKS